VRVRACATVQAKCTVRVRKQRRPEIWGCGARERLFGFVVVISFKKFVNEFVFSRNHAPKYQKARHI